MCRATGGESRIRNARLYQAVSGPVYTPARHGVGAVRRATPVERAIRVRAPTSINELRDVSERGDRSGRYGCSRCRSRRASGRRPCRRFATTLGWCPSSQVKRPLTRSHGLLTLQACRQAPASLGELETLLLLAILQLTDQGREAYGSLIREEVEVRAARAVPTRVVCTSPLTGSKRKACSVPTMERRRLLAATDRSGYSRSRRPVCARYGHQSPLSSGCSAGLRPCSAAARDGHTVAAGRTAAGASAAASPCPSTIGDLAEDYARRRDDAGRIRAGLWLVRETWSLHAAYRTSSSPRERRDRIMVACESAQRSDG